MEKLYGWAGNILIIDLSHRKVDTIATKDYSERFVGGKGIASRLYLELISSKTPAFSPDNHIFIMNGPLSGIRATATSRCVIVSKSPLTFPEQYCCGNLGGYFGAALKWAGIDGLDIYGTARNPSILLIEPGARCVLEDATELWGKDTFTTIKILQDQYGVDVQVMAIGKSGEQRVRFANVIGSGGVSVSKGFGAVMGSKNLKAIVVKSAKVKLPVAKPDDFDRVIAEINGLTLGESSGRYHNEIRLEGVKKVSNANCYGCPGTCRRGLYRSSDGEEGYRINCASAFFYRTWEKAKTGTSGSASFHATQLANRHGLCALQLTLICKWLPKAVSAGAVSGEPSLDFSQMGTSAWFESFVDLIDNRRGIGDILAEGSRRAAQTWGISDMLDGIVTNTGVLPGAGHDPRLFLSLAPIYATEPNFVTTQVHEVSKPLRQWMAWANSDGKRGFFTTEKLRNMAKLFWGDEQAVEFDSPDGKGMAAVCIQNRAYAKENLVACDWFWPINFSGNSDSGTGAPDIEARLLSSVTGVEMNEGAYLHTGARCFNQNRAIYLREGRRGRQDDVLEERFHIKPFNKSSNIVKAVNPEFIMPGTGGRLISRQGAKVDRDVFKIIMDDYYKIRGWDVETGLFIEDNLNGLGLADIVPELKTNGFIKQV